MYGPAMKNVKLAKDWVIFKAANAGSLLLENRNPMRPWIMQLFNTKPSSKYKLSSNHWKCKPNEILTYVLSHYGAIADTPQYDEDEENCNIRWFRSPKQQCDENHCLTGKSWNVWVSILKIAIEQ